MITDKLINIDKYVEIPSEIRNFVKTVSRDIPLGKIILDSENYANVEEYTTKTHDKCMFEAHKKYADIQILLSGRERLDYSGENGTIVQAYDESKDIMFLNAKETESIILDGTNFVFLLPEELHRPQMCIDSPKQVKKIVVKVKS